MSEQDDVGINRNGYWCWACQQHSMDSPCEHFPALLRAASEMKAALRELRKSVVGIVWERLGNTGDESDWFECRLCGARTRGSGKHLTTCPMSVGEAALKAAEDAK